MMNAFEDFCVAKMQGNDDAVKQIWNRAHLKALKLAGVVAVGINHETPAIDEETASWAICFIQHTIENTIKRFASGDMDGGSSEQYARVKQLFQEYEKMTPQKRMSYGCNELVAKSGIMFHGFLGKRLLRLACFKHDRRGVKRAITETIEFLIDNGEIIPVTDTKGEYKTSMKLYRKNF